MNRPIYVHTLRKMTYTAGATICWRRGLKMLEMKRLIENYSS